MDFSFSKSQQLLQKSARDYLKKECKELAREAEETAEGYSPETWKAIADLGWLGIGVSEQYSGIGGDFFDHTVVLQEMGRFLFPGPFIPSGVCATYLIHRFGSDKQKEVILPKMIEGKTIVIPALIHPEPYAGESFIEDDVIENTENGSCLFSGTRLFVPYADSADLYLIPVELPSEHTGKELRWLLVDAKDTGINCTTLKTTAHDRQHEVVFKNVSVPKENALGKDENGEEILKMIRETGSLAHSAYILGMLEQVLEMTVEYAKIRMQFDKPIGQFQAIQHQCADMMIDLEQVRYLTYQAAWRLSMDLQAGKEISMAKARSSDVSRRICLLGVKVHGGIGIIDEYDMQLYFRRAKAMELAFGDGDFHREIVAAELGL
ncbi:MAG: acyl-CoA/acyl-ACP dehydrogenase [Deltaproteobacteria bacterium]|nr:acyl-CoA/acyl-ACP dehydrogenase [Deltaproteobacteria bacterium]